MRTSSPKRASIARRLAISLVAVFAFAFTAQAAQADDVVANPGPFTTTISGGSININGLDMSLDDMDPKPSVSGTMNADGTFVIPSAGVSFPNQILPVDGPTGPINVTVKIQPTGTNWSGTLNPITGESTLDARLRVKLEATVAIFFSFGSNCFVGQANDGENIHLNPATSGSVPANPPAAAMDGVPYDSETGTTTIVNNSASVPGAAGCNTILGNNINTVVNDELGLPSASGQNTMELALAFNPVFKPAGPPPPEPFNLTLDNALLDFGQWAGLNPLAEGQEVILSGTVAEDGNLVLPAGDQVLPSTEFNLGGGQPLGTVSFEAANQLGGNWNENTGRLTVRGNVRAIVDLNGGPTCTTVDVLRFNTDTTQPYSGVRFTDGLEGAGAISASWEGLNPFTGDCADLNQFIEGPGGMWISRGIETPPGSPVSIAAPVLTGIALPGAKLTCEPGEWSGASRVGVVWTADGAVFDNAAPSGAQRRTYIVQQDDVDSAIACYEVGVNSLGRTDSDSSNSIEIGSNLPTVDVAPSLTTSNGTGNQVVDEWQVGWQLLCQGGSYSNPTSNPWIGITSEWASDGSVFPNPSPSGGTKMSYLSNAGDLGSEITCQQTATNIFGSTLAGSNGTVIVSA